MLLKTGIIHPPNNEKPVEIDYGQMATAQKLLLFWRKPAVSGVPLSRACGLKADGAAEMLVGRERCRASGEQWAGWGDGEVVGAAGVDAGAESGVAAYFSRASSPRPRSFHLS